MFMFLLENLARKELNNSYSPAADMPIQNLHPSLSETHFNYNFFESLTYSVQY